MHSELKQQRDAIIRKIAEDSTIITLNRDPFVDDGMGGTVENPFGIPVPHKIKARLSHEQSMVPSNALVPAGLSTNLNRFILTSYKHIIYENETFSAIEKQWKIGAVDPIYASGGIAGYQAPLQEAVT